MRIRRCSPALAAACKPLRESGRVLRAHNPALQYSRCSDTLTSCLGALASQQTDVAAGYRSLHVPSRYRTCRKALAAMDEGAAGRYWSGHQPGASRPAPGQHFRPAVPGPGPVDTTSAWQGNHIDHPPSQEALSRWNWVQIRKRNAIATARQPSPASRAILFSSPPTPHPRAPHHRISRAPTVASRHGRRGSVFPRPLSLPTATVGRG
jgi:hypothetical protein